MQFKAAGSPEVNNTLAAKEKNPFKSTQNPVAEPHQYRLSESKLPTRSINIFRCGAQYGGILSKKVNRFDIPTMETPGDL